MRAEQDDRRDYEAGLIDACIRGDWSAFERLVGEYADRVHRAAVKALASFGSRVSCDLEDLAFEFFGDVWQSRQQILGRFDAGRGPLARWLTRVAFHHCVNYLRSGKYRWPSHLLPCQDGELERVPDRPTPPDPAALIERLLAELSDTSRGIIQAKYGVGPFQEPLTVQEIAEQFGLTEPQVYRRIGKALRKVRELGSAPQHTDEWAVAPRKGRNRPIAREKGTVGVNRR